MCGLAPGCPHSEGELHEIAAPDQSQEDLGRELGGTAHVLGLLGQGMPFCGDAVHGVFSNPAYELLSSGIFDEILVTDSIPLSEKMLSLPFVHVVSLSPMLAQVITRIATDQPLSLIYETYGDNGTINNKHLVTKK